jgi:hypothetical protein
MRRQRTSPEVPERPRNDTSKALMDSILLGIADMFYSGREASPEAKKVWLTDQNFYKRHVVIWAARWLDSKGVTLNPDQFKAIILEKLLDVKRHSGQIQYLPRYLTKCIQDHFNHNKDEIYAKAKSVTAALDNALARAQIAQGGIDPIRVLAAAAQVIKVPQKPAAKAGNKEPDQLSLL